MQFLFTALFYVKENTCKNFEILLFVKRLQFGPYYAIYRQYVKTLNNTITKGSRI